jgi:hypothetical protein
MKSAGLASRTLAFWLALGLAVSSMALSGGCTREQPVVALELEMLAAQQANFQGRRVRTHGTLRMHAEPRHYWIEDAALNRVGLVPAEAVQEYLGSVIEVTGRFGFAPEHGRRIEVEAVEMLAPAGQVSESLRLPTPIPEAWAERTP